MSYVQIGLYVAGKIIKKQKWFGPKFGDALMVGAALYGVTNGFGLENVGENVVPPSVEGSLGEAGGGIIGESVGVDAMGAAGDIGAAADTSLAGFDPTAATSLSQPLSGFDPAMSSGVDSTLSSGSLMQGNTSAGSMFDAYSPPDLSVDSGLLGNTPPSPDPSFMDSKYAMPAMMVGGQALSGYASASKMEKIEKKKREEAERLRLLQTRFGKRTGGGGFTPGIGKRMAGINDRFFQNRKNQGGGLLS